MNRTKLLFLGGIFLGGLFITPSLANAFNVPTLTARVNDTAGIMSGESKNYLEQLLMNYEKETGNQFFVLTVNSVGDAGSIEQYGIAVADKWKAGQKNKDNGIIFIVAVKDRKVRIEVGYGLEGKLPDAAAGRVIRDVVVPEFRAGGYDAGITKGVLTVIKVIGGYETGTDADTAVGPEKKASSVIRSIGILIIIVFSILFRVIFSFGGIGRRGRRGGGGGMFFGGGGFGGGGFGGGGGGGFGGGGASGSW